MKKKISKPTPILWKLEEEQIFTITEGASHVIITESCDSYFSVKLSKEELRELGEELIGLSTELE